MSFINFTNHCLIDSETLNEAIKYENVILNDSLAYNFFLAPNEVESTI